MEKNNPNILVSICCLTYNHEKYISQAIEGFLSQKTSFPFEIIIHDDASTDSTATIIKTYEGKYPHLIKTIYQTENQFSKGIKPSPTFVWPKARGKYIALCEGDDYWTDPLKLQKQVNFLEANPNFSVCFHESTDLWDDGKTRFHTNISENRAFTLKDLTRSNFIATATTVFRNFTDSTLPEWFYTVNASDWALHFINSQRGDIYYMKDCMSVYRIHSNGIWCGLTDDQRMLKGIETLMAMDKGTNYKYTYDFTEGIKERFKKGNAEGIKKLINGNESLLKELNGYLEKPTGQKTIAENYFTPIKQAGKTLYDPFLNPELAYENMDLYIVRKNILNTIKNHLPEFKGTLLDLGCGEMPYKQYIISNSKVEKYIGLDIENPTYQKNTKPDLFWDGNQIPLENNSVDCVLATEFFEHVPYPEKILTEVQRVLRPGGFLLLTVPFIWPLHTMPFDEYRYTPFSLERILKNSGLVDINIKALGGWNASLAQVLGLWIRRSPMTDDMRKSYSEAFFPFYKSLIESDEIPDHFNDSMLITGLTASAKKKVDHEIKINIISTGVVNHVECPVCGKTFEKFKPYGANNQPNRCCPECGTVERHRLLWLYLTRKRNILSENLNLLDIAPTKGIGNKLKSMPNINYLSIDLTSPLAMRHIDITALDLPDNFYDCVLCYHVFEHIPDDRKAMREVLRVLKPGGWAILQVPINKRLEKTHEGAHIQDPAERRRLFGQEDHVRYYGLDYKDRLSEEGFIVYVDEFAKNLPDEEVKKYRLIKDEEIYFCTKPLIDSTNETNR